MFMYRLENQISNIEQKTFTKTFHKKNQFFREIWTFDDMEAFWNNVLQNNVVVHNVILKNENKRAFLSCHEDTATLLNLSLPASKMQCRYRLPSNSPSGPGSKSISKTHRTPFTLTADESPFVLLL